MEPLEFNKDIEDMNGAEARATLKDIGSRYSDAFEEYENMEDERDTFQSNAESANETLEQISGQFMEDAVDHTGISQDVLEDRFDADEIVEFGLEAQDVDPDVDDDDDDSNTFEDREQKSDDLPGDGGTDESKEAASNFVSQLTVDR